MLYSSIEYNKHAYIKYNLYLCMRVTGIQLCDYYVLYIFCAKGFSILHAL